MTSPASLTGCAAYLFRLASGKPGFLIHAEALLKEPLLKEPASDVISNGFPELANLLHPSVVFLLHLSSGKPLGSFSKKKHPDP
jgi:hypothetical protein